MYINTTTLGILMKTHFSWGYGPGKNLSTPGRRADISVEQKGQEHGKAIDLIQSRDMVLAKTEEESQKQIP